MKISIGAVIGLLNIVFEALDLLRPDLEKHADSRKVLDAAERAKELKDGLVRIAQEAYEENAVAQERAEHLARELAIAGGETDQAKLASM